MLQRGYLWLPKGSRDPFLGFTASTVDVHRSKKKQSATSSLSTLSPLLLPFASAVTMEGSRGSSSECIANGKHCLPSSNDAGMDSVSLEVELRAKLEWEQVARDHAARELEEWRMPPAWFQEEEWCKASTHATKAEQLHAGEQAERQVAVDVPPPSAASVPAAVDPWESAAARSKEARSTVVCPIAGGSRPLLLPSG